MTNKMETQITTKTKYVLIEKSEKITRDNFDDLYDIAKQNNLTGKIYVITKYYPFRDLDGKVVFKGKTTKKIMVKFVKGEGELK